MQPIPTTFHQTSMRGEGVIHDALRARIVSLQHRLGQQRDALITERAQRRTLLGQGTITVEANPAMPAHWKILSLPEELLERRVELLGGASRAELIEGINSAAKSYIADLWNMTPQDSMYILRGHRNLCRAAARTLSYIDPAGTAHRLNAHGTTRLFMAPRPLHLDETRLLSNEVVCAGLFDVVTYCSLNAIPLIARQQTICLYLRGVHSRAEASWWNTLFGSLEEELDLQPGSIRATVIIDSLSAALDAEGILFELRTHSAGLSLDLQGYAADHITLFTTPGSAVLPERERIGLAAHMLRSVSLLTVAVCHEHGAHAMGAPAFILPPDEEGRVKAGYMEMLADKEREALDGHDGTLVGHPGTVNAATMEFNKSMPKAHQMYYKRKDRIGLADLVKRPEGNITVESLTGMIRTSLRAMQAQAQGVGHAVQGGRVHDRSSVRLTVLLLWQWLHSDKGIISDSGLAIQLDLVSYLIKKEAGKMFGTDANERAVGATYAERLLDLVKGPEMPGPEIIF